MSMESLGWASNSGCQSNPSVLLTACTRDRTVSRWPQLLRNCTERSKLSSPLPWWQWGLRALSAALLPISHSYRLLCLTVLPPSSPPIAHTGWQLPPAPPDTHRLSPSLHHLSEVRSVSCMPRPLLAVSPSSLQPPICHPSQNQTTNHLPQSLVPFFQTSFALLFFLPSYGKVKLLNFPFQMPICFLFFFFFPPYVILPDYISVSFSSVMPAWIICLGTSTTIFFPPALLSLLCNTAAVNRWPMVPLFYPVGNVPELGTLKNSQDLNRWVECSSQSIS